VDFEIRVKRKWKLEEVLTDQEDKSAALVNNEWNHPI